MSLLHQNVAVVVATGFISDFIKQVMSKFKIRVECRLMMLKVFCEQFLLILKVLAT